MARAMRLLIVLAALLTAMAMPSAAAAAEDWSVALMRSSLDAYRNGDYRAARRGFKRLAMHGSAVAETMLGMIYAEGKGVAGNNAVSTAYFYRAADRGYGPAQVALSDAYVMGRGIGADVKRACFWAMLAARGSDSAAAEGAERETRLCALLDPAARGRIRRNVDDWRPRARRND